MIRSMYTDLFGNTRYKVNLHMHTSRSDGQLPTEKAIEIYRNQGYDALAITDHWAYARERHSDGMLLLSGAEYNIGGVDAAKGVYHILGIGTHQEPNVQKTDSAQEILDAIHKAGGLAVLAHPAWSLNTPEHIMALQGIDATEIYNSVSGVHMSRRPDSGLIVDMLATYGHYYPLIADDDTHYYDNDHCVSFIMVNATELTTEAICNAVRNGSFYASQGPEVHILREGEDVVVQCSPCSEIVLFSNNTWARRAFTGTGLTEARYQPHSSERYLRAEVLDTDGKRAWTNPILL